MLENRQQYQKMLGEELDLTVKVKLAAHGRSSTYLPQSTGKIKKKTREGERVAQKCYFALQQVCPDKFLPSLAMAYENLIV